MRSIVVLALVCACRSSPALDPGGERAAQLEARLARPCARPVLRGEPLPGPALADIEAATDPAGPLAACRQPLDELDRMTTWCEDPDDLPCQANSLVYFRKRADLPIADCASLVTNAISRATGHADGCSPPRDASAELVAVSDRENLVTFAVLTADELVTSGHAAEGLRRMLDAIQLVSDGARGGGGLLSAARALRTISMAARFARVAIAALPTADVDELGGEVDRLAAGLPPIYDAASSEPISPERDAIIGACPPDTTDAACAAAVDRAIDPATPRSDAMRVVAGFVHEAALAHAVVYQLALALQVRRLGRCPTAADWASPSLAARLAPARLGVALTASDEGSGTWRIDALPPIGPDGHAVTLARITCARP